MLYACTVAPPEFELEFKYNTISSGSCYPLHLSPALAPNMYFIDF